MLNEFEQYMEYLANSQKPPVDGTPWQLKEWEEARDELAAMVPTDEMVAQKRREFFNRF
jgi:hypothetical protein